MARYKMRQRLISIGEDFDIDDERGNLVYRVEGKVLRIRETFVNYPELKHLGLSLAQPL
jgi:uncharacterized protein YxjI